MADDEKMPEDFLVRMFDGELATEILRDSLVKIIKRGDQNEIMNMFRAVETAASIGMVTAISIIGKECDGDHKLFNELMRRLMAKNLKNTEATIAHMDLITNLYKNDKSGDK